MHAQTISTYLIDFVVNGCNYSGYERVMAKGERLARGSCTGVSDSGVWTDSEEGFWSQDVSRTLSVRLSNVYGWNK